MDSDSKPLISIIMPCYNASSFVKESVLSVINNTLFSKCELIVVDDGSTDNSRMIIDDLINSEPNKRIQYLKIDNSGVSVARNVGIEHANGEYLTFIDSDDIYSQYFLESLYSSICSANSDISVCYYLSSLPFDNKRKKDKRIPVKKLGEWLLYRTKRIGLWSMMYKSRIIRDNQISFDPNYKYGEDILFIWTYLSKCSSASLREENLYYYRPSPNSAMKKITSAKKQVIDVYKTISTNSHLNEMLQGAIKDYGVPRAVLSVLKDYGKMRCRSLYDELSTMFTDCSFWPLVFHGKVPIRIASLAYIISPKLFYHFTSIGSRI